MNFYKTAILAAVIAAPAPLLAQGFTGAELEAGILAFSDDHNLGETMYTGGVELGIMQRIGIGANFSYNGFRGFDGDSSSMTLHGLYGLNDRMTAGLFVAQDRRDEGDTDIYGIEGAANMAGIEVQGYLGRFDGVIGDGTMFGVDGRFAFNQNIAATASAGVVNGDAEMSRVSLGGEYRFGNGPFVYAEFGKADVFDSSENFVAVGARIELGQGTTFGARGLTDLLPGY